MRTLPADDDGLPDQALEEARSSGSRAVVLAAWGGCRVFAAVGATATATHVTESGLQADSTAEMAVLLIELEGRRALPVFRDVAGVLAWQDDARPVRLSGRDACRAALDEGAEAVVLDPGGAALTLDTDEVRALADGWVPVVGAALASRMAMMTLAAPAQMPVGLVVALGRALATEDLRAARLVQGPEGLVVGVTPRTPLDAAALAGLANRVRTRLGSDLPPTGLDLAQVPLRGPGVALLRRTPWSRLKRGR